MAFAQGNNAVCRDGAPHEFAFGNFCGMLVAALPPLAVKPSATSATVAPLGAASGYESSSIGDRLRAAIYLPPAGLYTAPGDDFVLAQAIVVHRHGDRSPISHGAGSKMRLGASTWAARLPPAADLAALNASFPVRSLPAASGAVHGPADAPFAQLTRVGGAQCVALGAAVRESLEAHAPHLLQGDGLRGRVLVHATARKRTQLSAQHVLRGLFGPELGTEHGAEHGPQREARLRVRVPVLVRPIDDEPLLPCPQSCGALKQRMRQVSTAATAAVEPEAQALMRHVGEALGYAKANATVALSRLDEASDVASCYVAHGDLLPAALSEEDVLAMLGLNTRLSRDTYSDPQVGRLGMGRLLAEIEGWLAAAARRDSEAPRLVLLSGHDSTLVPLLASLQLFDAAWSWPPYTAHVRIELAHARRGGAPAARLLYQGRPLTAVGTGMPVSHGHGHADQSPGAGWISLEAFQELLRPARITADQYAKECVRKVDVEPERGGGGDAALQHTLSVDNVLVQ